MVSSESVKKLREMTGAGMMACKQALESSGGRMEDAVQWLRKKGLASAGKKADRAANEGLIGVAVDGEYGVAVEINSETDFVARNEEFKKFASSVVGVALKNRVKSVAELMECPISGSTKVNDALLELISKVGENIVIKRVKTACAQGGVVASYVHGTVGESLGRMVALVALKSSAGSDSLMEIGRDVAMHVVAARPRFLNISSVPSDIVEKETAMLREQASGSNKPEAIVDKMIQGRISKFFNEIVLEEQSFVKDPEISVRGFVDERGKKLGHKIVLVDFFGMSVGETAGESGTSCCGKC
ncbi:elongation factor Ts [Candidatus Hydrogenosomobacter endosymbioticus]|uniref:Elongation factor Ts n=2 Tax=Candidatus Hydrogenosomobacter endosymbioticus TaxID=2558174 RepID=A0ABM7V8E6_9PROT|nr:elongation factor Ts [Candidatus Hydrogenosomobacter endosymbioticus]